MKITSPAFVHNTYLPSKYTCDGLNASPPLEFSDVPEDTKSLVLLMEDPDVPKQLKPDGLWTHWVVYNIDPKLTEVPENQPPGIVGLNSGKVLAYYGACPPDGEHRYFFTLYALDTKLDFPTPAEVTKQMIVEAMQDHILYQAELIGRYKRK